VKIGHGEEFASKSIYIENLGMWSGVLGTLVNLIQPKKFQTKYPSQIWVDFGRLNFKHSPLTIEVWQH
jgi:hypothetical protein